MRFDVISIGGSYAGMAAALQLLCNCSAHGARCSSSMLGSDAIGSPVTHMAF
jgi:anaerobic glycerol-3-phosphate dehydrogenase